MYQMLRLKISNPEALIFTFYVFWRKIVAKLEFYEQVKITIEVFSLQYYCLKFLRFECFFFLAPKSKNIRTITYIKCSQQCSEQ